ncbi:SDR family NAD(P)-dependent oxidoreductase [Caldimonas thermodepolymerans]|jgi:NAD(P)-dependent dehydrogenase (short-subunit alcohol dehydrogenase family)|uniref:SDR family NAD(P)-dependent oxidoreductase n=1 Tax=Caldimonas thermodepolymerans TaxID=215580 RepID=UPI002236001A|nr:SDR family NAD(P)-dependent oxidoreductase [Caldimonas thermodepolymerans]UZG46059.1 SDR family oxidoreductase [Caldimonas thermodepolymerans]
MIQHPRFPALPGPHPGRFDGQVAIVTGGASGIGAATCRRLVAEGARVVIADINADAAHALADELGENASAAAFDAADVASIQRVIEGTVDRFGRLDVLHNNAAISTPAVHAADKNAIDIEFELWDRVMAVNLRGYLAGCKYALPVMIRQGRGAIVNTASTGGFAGDITRLAYSVSKAAIIGLTRQIATHHGAQGVRCNAVAPGLVLTPGVRGAAATIIDVVQRHLLVPAPGEPEDIAALVCFLASTEARYINGQTYIIDGGMLAHNPMMADLVDMARQRG